MPRKVSPELAAVVEELAPEIELRLSARRRKTISARQEAGRIVVMAPDSMSPKRLREDAVKIAERVAKKTTASRVTDSALLQRAHHLNATVLGGRAEFTDIRWVTTMERRWGSCSTGSGRIRISHYLQDVPDYVLDQVIVHELVHTFIPNHSPEFYQWARMAPDYERAQGYLEAYQRWGKHE